MEFETKVQFLTQPEHNRRTIVISDIHGHRAWLEKLLKKVDFSEKDILIIVGDMIEKGPESLNTIRYIMELCEKYTVYPMMGNVDLWRIQMLLTEDGSLDQELYETNERMRQYWKATFLPGGRRVGENAGGDSGGKRSGDCQVSEGAHLYERTSHDSGDTSVYLCAWRSRSRKTGG